MLPNYNKALEQLHAEWKNCTQCDLGKRREDARAEVVVGEGDTRGVMFIGGGPGKREEREGRPFVGKPGAILHKAIQKLGFDRWYISNLVACRSCIQEYDGQGNPMFSSYRGITYPKISDYPPNPMQINTCAPRLHEEIYLVDPVVIVALGAEAAKALSSKSVSIVTQNAHVMPITIPGAGHHAVVTEKRKLWLRKVKDAWVLPVAQNQVQYLMVPVVHPAHLLSHAKDPRPGNPVEQFIEGMRVAARIYAHYMLETYGDQYVARQITDHDIRNTIEED